MNWLAFMQKNRSLWWDHAMQRGTAFCGGVSLDLLDPPYIPGLVDLMEIEFFPVARKMTVRQDRGQWRDLIEIEIATIDELLDRMAAGAMSAFTRPSS